MYAFVEAALAGTDVLEMDLQMTADGVLVVHHDATVDRHTETTGRVRDLTVAELGPRQGLLVPRSQRGAGPAR